MTEKIARPTGHIGSGSALLWTDTTPITAAEGSRDIGPIDCRMCNNIGGDIISDKDCTLTVIRLPDLDALTEGAPSAVLSVTGGTPEPWDYSDLKAPRVIIRVANTSGQTMNSFLLTCRGGA